MPTKSTNESRPYVSLTYILEDLGDETGPLPKSTFADWLAKGRAPHGVKLPNGQWRFDRQDYRAWKDALPHTKGAAT